MRDRLDQDLPTRIGEIGSTFRTRASWRPQPRKATLLDDLVADLLPDATGVGIRPICVGGQPAIVTYGLRTRSPLGAMPPCAAHNFEP